MSAFLHELNDSEILDRETSAVVEEVVSVDAATILLDSVVEAVLAPFNSEEDIEESDSNDDIPLALIISRSPRNIYLQRQRKYSKKYCKKRERNHTAMAHTFVAGLKLLKVLVEDRIQRTKMVTMTRRLVDVNKSDKWYEVDLHTIEQEATQQLVLIHGTMQFIDVWKVTWYHCKSEYGRCFLKSWVLKVENGFGELVEVGKKLAEEMIELEFCLLQKPSGVWI
ncbi:uncharacterized protein IUM83_02816 [Phytophthora cinnamomi]|uniref:uncharacterized protein n=1 Tax=Phytophthora cinnamomi TaxID=4785 RepID=UPI00355A5A4A|nr:hypothetical protein IUM83_02816 [Phytophthora cinnamomi]